MPIPGNIVYSSELSSILCSTGSRFFNGGALLLHVFILTEPLYSLFGTFLSRFSKNGVQTILRCPGLRNPHYKFETVKIETMKISIAKTTSNRYIQLDVRRLSPPGEPRIFSYYQRELNLESSKELRLDQD